LKNLIKNIQITHFHFNGVEDMRRARKITAKEENFRTEPFGGVSETIKRDFVKPEPEGTIILMTFRIVGYDKDCDGSAMARLENIDQSGETTGWTPHHIGMGEESTLVITKQELKKMFKKR
jgi:hypothetical protein